MIDDKILSKTINNLRLPLTIGVVYIHFSLSEGLNIHGTFYGRENPTWFFFIVNLISEVFAKICVPVFFIISGFLFFNNTDFNKHNYISKLRSRIRSLLIPYIIWNLIAAICLFCKSSLPLISSFYPPLDIKISLSRLFCTLFCNTGNSGIFIYPADFPPPIEISPINIPLWYIRELMIMVILAPIIYFMTKKGGAICIFLLGIIWYSLQIYLHSWHYLGMFLGALFFFSWGAYYSINKKNIILSFREMRIIPFFYITIAIIDALTKGMNYNIYIHLFGLPLGAIFVFNCVSYITEHKDINIHQIITNSSFFIYACHTLFMSDMGKYAFKILNIPENNPFAMLLFYISVPLISITICYSLFIAAHIFLPNICKLLTGGR